MDMIGDNIINFLLEKNGKMAMNIAFLPYCYQMWDCMESVYESAIKKGIGVGVFPIPYFTLKDGKIDEWHNEHELFEGTIDKEDLYDFNDFLKCYRDIDYVIIHNAYDDGNNLTTVNPLFYTDKLKGMGVKIVFIPYGIFLGGKMTRQKGILNCDYIIVNDDAERETFLESWKEIDVDMSDRCFAFGSPKFDTLIKNNEMPRAWKRKIAKTVILVCTSLVPFLNNPKGKLEQYRDVVWNELANGHMVIFRPHPLMDSLIKTRFSKLYDEWTELLEWIGNDCIVDNETDLATEIQYSDRLISDASSVVELWKATGKPYKVLE